MPEEPYPLKPIFGILFTEINEKEKFPQSWKNKRRILPMAELKCPHCGQAYSGRYGVKFDHPADPGQKSLRRI